MIGSRGNHWKGGVMERDGGEGVERDEGEGAERDEGKEWR